MGIFQLFACKNQILLVRWNVLLFLDFSFDILDSVTKIDLECVVLPIRVFIKIYISVSAVEAARPSHSDEYLFLSWLS